MALRSWQEQLFVDAVQETAQPMKDYFLDELPGDGPIAPERSLACAKLLTMFQDLGGRSISDSHKGSKDTYKLQAEQFFFSLSKARIAELERWCDDAGLHPDDVRQKAREILKSGLPAWRKAPGKGKRYKRKRKAKPCAS